MANYLIELGLEPGDRVTVQAEKSPEFLWLFLGCLRAGLVFHPLNTAYTEDELRFFLGDAAPSLVVCDGANAATMASLCRDAGVASPCTLNADGSGSLFAGVADASDGFTTVARAGADLAIADVLAEDADVTAGEIAGACGVRAEAFGLDVTDAEAAVATVKSVVDAFGKIDILVNNAGVTRDNLVLRMSDEEWDGVLRVNLKGAFLMTRAAARPMLKARTGSIVNVASVVGQMGNAGQANYAASKAGLIGLTKSCAKEFAPRGVRVNAVAPGYIRTAMTEKLGEEAREAMLSGVPLGRPGEAEDVARAVRFLASDEAAYVTGQVLRVCGGMVM